MKKYGYTTVIYTHSEITVHSTDADVLRMVKAEVVKAVPDCHVLSTELEKHPDNHSHRLPNGDPCLDTFNRLAGRDREVGWWILKTLTAQGWEPFHIDGSGDWDNLFDSKERIHLRIEYA